MKEIENILKKLLFKCLSFSQYLTLISRSYFLLYRMNFLKNNSSFKYHYFLKNVINKGDTVIDIGANLGYFSIPFSQWVGKEGVVYWVEPLTQMREVFKKNIGTRKNITILPYALGNENKKIIMGNNTRIDNEIIATGSHFVLEENATAIDEFSAEMRKGSELFNNLEKLHFIKCDIEGYENVVIPEIKQILIEHKPLMLIETKREKRVFLLNFLLDIGFSGFVLEDKKLYLVSDIKGNKEDDILFIHENKLDLFTHIIAKKTTNI